MNFLVQVVSLLGALLILGAFFTLQRGWWTAHDSGYLWANCIGATLLTAVAVWDRRLGFIVLEGAWALVALMSIVRGPPRDP